MSKIIGIDLGTSTSEIAYVKDGVPVLIPNLDGEVVTPSVVSIGENGEIVVGQAAEHLLFTRPDCTFMEVKRLFGTGVKLSAHGKEYDPEEIQSYLIKYLVECAQNYLRESITTAVITVPAYFTDVQRRQTVR
ncbi:MAG: Hsp70 family protein, partial [Oscillospiraceae bacterium]|nr:Hsp70 family protein [Oscillospiraceae bacterium]